MFLKKAVEKTFKRNKRQQQSPRLNVASVTPYCDERSASVESSEVEYVEDEEHSLGQKDLNENKRTPTHSSLSLSQPSQIEHEHDRLLSISIEIPKVDVSYETDSTGSNGRNIITKLPSHLAQMNPSTYTGKLPNRKIESKPSMATSTTSEEQFTQSSMSVSENMASQSSSISDDSVKMKIKKQQQLEYWTDIIKRRLADEDSEGSSTTALCLMELGTMYLYCEKYSFARDCFSKAISVFEKIYGEHDLRVAKASERLGVAELSSYTGKNYQKKLYDAMSYLDRAFRIRVEKLGNMHIDTVETLNNIAGVQMKQEDFSGARDSYYEVFKMREAIFGSWHPCVAIAAHMLATAYTRLFQVKGARFYFNLALKTYERNGMGHHPFANTIRRDLDDLRCTRTIFEV